MTKIRGIVNRKVKESTTMYKVRALPPPLPPPPAAAAASTACGHRRGADRRDPPAAARTYAGQVQGRQAGRVAASGRG
jgi:hypothetical protein